jgi:cob(I)alamin adenosyltransferase
MSSYCPKCARRIVETTNGYVGDYSCRCTIEDVREELKKTQKELMKYQHAIGWIDKYADCKTCESAVSDIKSLIRRLRSETRRCR